MFFTPHAVDRDLARIGVALHVLDVLDIGLLFYACDGHSLSFK